MRYISYVEDGVRKSRTVPFTPRETEERAEQALLEAEERARLNAPDPAPGPSGPVEERDLTAAEFAGVLGYTGLDAVWDLMIKALHQAPSHSNRKKRMVLKFHRSKNTYRLAETLRMVEEFRYLAVLQDASADLSNETIKSAWAIAATELS